MSHVVHYCAQAPRDASLVPKPLRTPCGFFSASVTSDPHRVTCKTCRRLVQPLLESTPTTPTPKSEKPTMRSSISTALFYLTATLVAACGTPVAGLTTSDESTSTSTTTADSSSSGADSLTSSSSGEEASTGAGASDSASTSGAGSLGADTLDDAGLPDDTSTGTSTGDEDTTAAASTGTTGADDTSTTGPGLVSVAAEPSTTTGADASSTGDGTTGDGTTGEPPEVALCFGDACDGDAPACPKGLVCKHDPETWIATCASPGPCVIGEPCQIEAGLCGFPPLTECRTDLDDQVNRCFALTCEEDADCPVGVCADERCYLL